MFGDWLLTQSKRFLFVRVVSKKGKFTPFVRVIKRNSANYERVKSHFFVAYKNEYRGCYYNPFTGEKKRTLDKNDFLIEL